MCPCIFYLYFCKETRLSVNRVIFWSELHCFPNWTSNTFEARIWWEHLWAISSIFKWCNNIGTMSIWFRIKPFLRLKWKSLGLISPISLNDKAETDNLSPRLPCQWTDGWTLQPRLLWLQGSFPLHPSHLSKWLESVSPCLSAWYPCSQSPREEQIFILNYPVIIYKTDFCYLILPQIMTKQT